MSDWDGSRRGWTGVPEDGSRSEKVSDQPYRLRLKMPQEVPKPEAQAPERVGYGKPPREHRFKPGQSGNPKGRPVGSKNKLTPHWGNKLTDIMEGELFRSIAVREGEKQVSMPVVQGVLRAATVTAMKGSTRAQKLVLETAIALGLVQTARHQEYVLLALEHKFKAEEEIRDRLSRGITDTSDIIPHPDDMIVDLEADTIRINGPQTAEQKKAWDEQVALKRMTEDILTDLRDRLAAARSRKRKETLQEGIDRIEAFLVELTQSMPDWKIRE